MKLIVAVDEKWNIGKNGDLLCHLSEDLKYFKEKTMGNVVVMGRKTLESLPGGNPLPGRTNVVITGNESFKKEGCEVVHSVEEALELEKKYHDKDVMIIGGGTVYREFLPYCDTCYITKIHKVFEADTSIENLDENENFIIKKHTGMKEENGIKFQSLEYVRI